MEWRHQGPKIPALRRLRHKDFKIKAFPSYPEKPSLKREEEQEEEERRGEGREKD